MEYMHSRGIVLRDLKPGNVGFDERTGTVKLFDFGMARPVRDCDPNELCGSPKYMAPEIMSKMLCGGGGDDNEGLYSLGVDVYSFGVVLYELCSLHVPFSSSSKPRNNRICEKKRLSWLHPNHHHHHQHAINATSGSGNSNKKK